MKILNKIIPILMRFYNLFSSWSVASYRKPHKGVRRQMKCDVNNDAALFPTEYRRMYCRIFDIIQSDVAFKKQVH